MYWCKFFRIISNDISSTTWTIQNKEHLLPRKLSSLDPILYINFLVLSTVPEDFPSILYNHITYNQDPIEDGLITTVKLTQINQHWILRETFTKHWNT